MHQNDPFSLAKNASQEAGSLLHSMGSHVDVLELELKHWGSVHPPVLQKAGMDSEKVMAFVESMKGLKQQSRVAQTAQRRVLPQNSLSKAKDPRSHS